MPSVILAPTNTGGSVDFPDIPGVIDVPVNRWPGIQSMTFKSDEQDFAWDLFGGASGVLLMPDGIRGLTMPKVTHYVDESPAVDGSRWRGYRTLAREVFWPLLVYSDDGSQEWLNHDRKLWEAFEPDRVGTWTIEQPNGTLRKLRVRFVDDGDYALTRDPSRFGWAAYGIKLLAEQPYWTGPTISNEWTNPAPVDFFNTTGGPPFNISPSNTIGTALMPNPGRVARYPVWTIFGPTTSVTLGLAGRLIQIPFSVAAGKALVIDTRPQAQTAMDANAVTVNGRLEAIETNTELTGSLGTADFAPIPSGESVELSLTMTGTGTVRCEFEPAYWRAW